MADKKTDQDKKSSKRINKLAELIQSNMDKLYQTTYYSNPTNKKDLDNIKSKIDASIGNIVSNNVDTIGLPNISKMYARVFEKNRMADEESSRKLQEMLSDKALVDTTLATFAQNSKLADLDNKIDTILKYMPRLQEALDVRKDNVLSADHFNKDYITITSAESVSTSDVFNKRLKEIKQKYKLLELFEDIYDETAKYGEYFIYNVPYKRAISKLLQTKAQSQVYTATLKTESMDITSEIRDTVQMPETELFSNGDKNYNINLQINRSGMLANVIESFKEADDKLGALREQSLCYIREDKIENITDIGKKTKPSLYIDDGFMPDDLDFSGFDDTATDGLVTGMNGKSERKIKIDVPGCVIKKLDRRQIIPIYIEDSCMGYYYIENIDGENITDFTKLEDPFMSMRNNSTIIQNSEADMKRDMVLKYLAGEMSKYIDQEFVNNNQDLRAEIYMILKYNDVYNTPNSNFRVTFLPPEDVTHVYFRKDPKTHRGISDLDRSIIPGTLYASLYITDAIAAMTRSQDKRVYYVKQTVDTNIAKTLLTTIEQIKKNNFNIRQIENVNHILNITGRFNDYVIPMSPSGEAPITMEVMQGQQVNSHDDLLNRLEEMAINPTDVPLELIQARQSIDYAVQYTMSNSKFLRKVYKRQAQYEPFMSTIITKIYNYEYDESIQLEIKLPPPMFLNITNTNQIMMNTNDFAQAVADIYLSNEPDDVTKNIFTKKLKLELLGSYIDVGNLEHLLNIAKQETSIERDEAKLKQEE